MHALMLPIFLFPAFSVFLHHLMLQLIALMHFRGAGFLESLRGFFESLRVFLSPYSAKGSFESLMGFFWVLNRVLLHLHFAFATSCREFGLSSRCGGALAHLRCKSFTCLSFADFGRNWCRKFVRTAYGIRYSGRSC